MSVTATLKRPKDRLSRIAAQIERLDSRVEEWAPLDPWEGLEESLPTEEGQTPFEDPRDIRDIDERHPGEGPDGGVTFQWENDLTRAILPFRGGSFGRLVQEMRGTSKEPFSHRTKQISVLCAFVPFFISVMAAAIRHLPYMPSMSVWAKITWFLAFPMFLAVTGAFVGFLIGIMLDTVEAQAKQAAASRRNEVTRLEPTFQTVSPGGMKSAVWVAVEDLEPNQRVAETVLGEDGTPLLLRHTLLKPSHLEMLRKTNVQKVKVEAVKYPTEGDLALAG
ncbi:MAG: hypothetical protein HUU16_05995 [Candidatus Omnitrophica bacterium]|nr:hypothetical protein [Candidatus Omnitrophota bacterium]